MDKEKNSKNCATQPKKRACPENDYQRLVCDKNTANSIVKTKILQVCHSYDPPFLDVANQYAAAFDSNRFEITCLFLKGKDTAKVREQTIADKLFFLESSTKDMRGLKTKIIKKLRRILTEEAYSLVIAHRYKSIYLIGLASLLSRPVQIIGVVHAYNVFSRLPRKLLVFLLRKRIKLLGVSQSIRHDILNYLKTVTFKQVYSLPNCVDIDKLQKEQLPRSAARQKLGFTENTFIIATVGRVHPEKDQATLIYALQKAAFQMPDARLYIFGTGPLTDDLKSLIVRLGLTDRVFLAGFVPEIAKLFCAFDLFVLPSRIEPFGMVLIEAMSARIPVLSSKSGGGAEILNNNEDLLFVIGDVDGLAAKLIIMYQLTAAERENHINFAANRVHRFFSQQAFNQNFWKLPFLKNFPFQSN
ncbi:MAG: glycosyltransferase [Desulfobulbaceae bacterium]|nr:glycosyltransferase [Desulfobulbaceae bacterium]